MAAGFGVLRGTPPVPVRHGGRGHIRHRELGHRPFGDDRQREVGAGERQSVHALEHRAGHEGVHHRWHHQRIPRTAALGFPGPGTYCYRPQLGGTDLLDTDPSPRVTAAAPPGSGFSFAVLGDWGAGTVAQANVLSLIGASPARFVVTTGDNVYTCGTGAE